MRAWRTVTAAVLLSGTAHAAGDAGTAPLANHAIPCKGCIAQVPDGTDPVPLAVILHGDGQDPAKVAAAWGPALGKRGIALLAPTCPKALGCQGSYWRWNPDASWLTGLVSTLASQRAVDSQRTWLIGWSGGASYMGYRTQELEESFRALVFHGGGMAPAVGTCSSAKSPVFFLVGDANPLHGLAKDLRSHYDRCSQDVHWTLLKGADHGGEWQALPKHIDALLDGLTALPLRATLAVPDAGPGAAPEDAGTSPAPSPSEPVAQAKAHPSANSAAANPPPSPRAGCAIRRATYRDEYIFVGFAVVLGIAVWRRKKTWPLH